MNAPWVEVGWTVHAPVTVGTNLVLGAQCALLGLWIRRASKGSTARRWTLFFLFMSAATLVGAIKHGQPPDTRGALWIGAVLVSNTSGGLATASAQLATVRTWVRQRRARSWFRCFIVLQAVAVVLATALWPGFTPALINTVVGLAPVLAVEIRAAFRGRSGGRALAIGFALTALAGALFAVQTGLEPWLRPVDLAHLVMAASLVLVYVGVRERVRTASPVPRHADAALRPGRRDR